MVSEMVRTQVDLPRDMFELLTQRGEVTQQILEALEAYLENQADPILQADDPIFQIAGAVDSGVGDLSVDHDRYLYRGNQSKQSQAGASG